GIGKQLLKASEEHASQLQCSSIYMRVVSVRTELIDWYKRHGYVDTGQRDPFEDDGSSGRHLQKLEFMIMEKQLAGNKN
ncbi:MAG TPA: GNAT family N-acetyltransferase, partial [Ferruginibacter sp.]|nr:GNAT family N-acetyltransferase [Ferruginibacter sp.]